MEQGNDGVLVCNIKRALQHVSGQPVVPHPTVKEPNSGAWLVVQAEVSLHKALFGSFV